MDHINPEQIKTIIDKQDNLGRTPLHIAASVGNEEMVKYLLKHGAKPDIKDNLGNSPLHHAAKGGKFKNYFKICELLVNQPGVSD